MKLTKVDIKALEALLTLVDREAGRLIIVYDEHNGVYAWSLSASWGHEAEDSPMYAGSISEVGNFLPDILKKARDTLG